MYSIVTITHYEQLVRHTKRLIQSASTRSARSLLVISNVTGQDLEKFSRLINAIFIPAISSSDRSDRISSLLGSERRSACVQLAQKPDLGLLAALAGTIQLGGLLVIGIYDGVRSCAADKDTSKVDGDVADRDQSTSRSNQSRSTARLIRLAIDAASDQPDNVEYVRLANAIRFDDELKQSDLRSSMLMPLPHSAEYAQTSLHNPDAAAEQDDIFRLACTHWNTHRNSCIVIRGLRGRGKSHLLARLALHLQRTGVGFVVTARHKSALSEFSRLFKSANEHYISPEAAILSTVDTLLVDEAANLSIAQLTTYLDIYPHVVLCTTSDGYETAGRAFDVQLLAQWTHSKKHLLQLTPRCPWRWKKNDPLEHFIHTLCLSTPEISGVPGDQTSGTKTSIVTKAVDFTVRKIHPDELVHDDILFRNIVDLLFATHYQSTTKDMTLLLDAPSSELWVQERDKNVAAVLLVEREGRIPYELHEPVVGKQRRLPNQLLPQLLAQTANNGRALSKCYLRVVRLAVASHFRRHGLASQLLEEISRASQIKNTQSGISAADAIGASFAPDKVSRSFWRHHGYQEFHHSFRKNPRTGQRALTCLKTFDKSCREVLDEAVAITNDNISARSTTSLDRQEYCPIGNIDLQLLKRYIDGQRSEHDTTSALQKLLALFPMPEKGKAAGSGHKGVDLREHARRCLQDL